MIIKHTLKNSISYFYAFTVCLVMLMTTKMSAQNGTTISGQIKDNTGIPLPGVNILEKGTTNGVSADFDGKYTIKLVNSKSSLIFTYIGYKPKEIPVVFGKNKIDVDLAEDANSLNEVIVIGYGTVKKSDLTGAVDILSGSDLKKIPIPNVAEALTGRLAGVRVVSSEGSPDADVQIRVRGGGSLTQNGAPLVIVDGFPVNSLNDISSYNIESITVLKDASSTAIYGSRGANGVIIVTTKKGNDGKIAVSFNTFYGGKVMANSIDVLDTQDFVKWQYEYALLKKDVPSYTKYFGNWQDYDMYKGAKGNDWQSQIYGRQGEVKNYDLGIRGGSEKVNFNFNYSHYDEKAIMVGSDFNRNNILLTLNNKASDKIDLGFTVRYSDSEVNGGGANEQNQKSSSDSRLKNSVGYSPIPIPGLTTDNTDEALSGYLVNPFVAVADNNRLQTKMNYNMLGSFSWKLIEDLQFKSEFGLDNYNYLDYRYYGTSTYYVNNAPAADDQGMPAMIINDTKNQRFRNANTLNYDFKKLLKNENNSLTVLVGEEIINNQSNQVTTTIQGYPKFFTFEQAKNLTTQGNPVSVDNYYSPEDKLLSFFGRINYSFKDRYLLTATYRADGSSKFTGDNQWGYFPSVAGAWKISEENFLKDSPWISLLKLRLSYGEAGNNNIPVGQTVQTFQSYNSTWINGFDNYWSASKTLANPDLTWETSVQQNIGLDFDFWHGILGGSFEVYKNVTQDLLIQFPVAGTGYDYQYRNMGEVQNTGFEATLNIIAIEKPDYGLSFNFNMGINKNRINSLGDMNSFPVSTGWASSEIQDDYFVNEGGSIGQMFGYKNNGRYEVADFDYDGTKYVLKPGIADASGVVSSSAVQPGYMKLQDLNGDGKITAADKTVIGNANPLNTGGFVINANAYHFDLSAAFNWSYGNDVYNANKVEFTTTTQNGQYRNLSSEMADGTRWTNLDPATGQLVTDPAALTALNANTTMWSPYMRSNIFTDWAVEDGSFLRLNTITLGYTAPDFFNEKMGIGKLRFYVTGSNLFLFTKYSGPDPDVNTKRDTPLTPSVDYSAYPRSKQLVFGINLNF